jgi:hypothetical protein
VPIGATAAVNGTPDITWQTVGSLDGRGRNLDGRVDAVEYGRRATAGRVFIGGEFTRVEPPRDESGSAVARAHVAAFSKLGDNLVRTWKATVKFAGSVDNARVVALAISADGKVLFVGGRFTSVNGKRRGNVAALNARTGRLLRWHPRTNGGVHSLEVGRGGQVYLGGTFTAVNGQPRLHIAAVRRRGGALLGWSPDVTQPHVECPPRCAPDVFAMSLAKNVLYFGGSFASVNGRSRNSAAAVTTGGRVTRWNPNVFHEGQRGSLNKVYDLAVAGRSVFLCGDFWRVHSFVSPNVAAVSRRTGKVRKTFNLVTDGAVNGCAVSAKANALFLGGHFDHAGTRAALHDDTAPVRHHVAAGGRSNGGLLSWSPEFNSVPGVWAVDAFGTKVGFGGDFTQIDGNVQKGFAQFGVS